MAAPLLEIRNVKKYYPVKKVRNGEDISVKAVDQIDLTVNQGEIVGLVGESGCGKSTLGKTILKLHDITGGQILFHGEDITNYTEKQMRPLREKIQIIFQDPFSSLQPRMPVGEIIGEAVREHGLVSKEEFDDYIDQVMDNCGLQPFHKDRYPHEFSGGQRQRICIARALALNPEFIVCDEPISALDVSIQAQIVNLLIRLQKEKGLTYLFIAHDLAMVKHISDRVAVMYLGNIVEITQASALYANPMHPYTQALLSAIPIPDPEVEEKKQRIRLEGELPSPVDPPEGCRFINRCRFASERCRKERPELLEMEPGHLVACHCCEEMKKGQI